MPVAPAAPSFLAPHHRRLATLALATFALAAPLAAQRPAGEPRRPVRDSVARDTVPRDTVPRDPLVDSLRARLEKAEAAIELLKTQLAGESESAVHSRSRVRVDLSGVVLTTFFSTSGRANVLDVPQSVIAPPLPGAAPQSADGAFGVTLRQTRLGAAVSVDQVAGGTFGGDFELDFFGGAQNAPGDRRLFPEPRLRTARALINWARTELMFGMETPLISDLNPVSLAAVGIPDFSGAGNLWNWLGQARLTRELGVTGVGELRWAITGAVMAPYAGSVYPGEQDAVDAGERSRRPAFETRLRARWGGDDGDETIVGGMIAPQRGGEIGLGAHLGWIEASDDVVEQSYALAADAVAVLVPGRVELRGEWYTGRLLRGLGGGAIGQNFGNVPAGSATGAVGAPLRDVAGWAQLNVQPHAVLLTGIGCGIDLVDARDVPTRMQNTSCAAQAQWRPAQPLVFALEYRQIGTRYARGTFGARHVNLGMGFEY